MNLKFLFRAPNNLTPSIAANAGSGTGPTVAIEGSSIAGTITLTPGTTPTVADLLTVTLAHGGVPTKAIVVLTPANATAAQYVDRVHVGTVTKDSFKLTARVALAAGTYVWNYTVIGY